MNPLIIFHDNCYDGITGAWIVKQIERTASVFPGKYGEDPPHVAGRVVYIVDFAYSREIMLRMSEEATALTVFDHHISAQRACADLEFCYFDMDKSGAGIAWDYFHPGIMRPKWIDRVEDRDLWRFRYDDTKVFHAYMSSFPIMLSSCDQISNTDFGTMLQEGHAIRRYIDNSIKKLMDEAKVISLYGLRVAVVNAPYQYASETAGNLLDLYAGVDCAIAWFHRRDGKFQYSLRSRIGSNIDVSKIAKQHGGGGHKHASGYTAPWLPQSLG